MFDALTPKSVQQVEAKEDTFTLDDIVSLPSPEEKDE
jgi:hypothetical protein